MVASRAQSPSCLFDRLSDQSHVPTFHHPPNLSRIVHINHKPDLRLVNPIQISRPTSQLDMHMCPQPLLGILTRPNRIPLVPKSSTSLPLLSFHRSSLLVLCPQVCIVLILVIGSYVLYIVSVLCFAQLSHALTSFLLFTSQAYINPLCLYILVLQS
jgi:hypothetical protein